ncbi:hypothetical protein [Halalkalicoccus tibetensis]|uniref:SIR2-like domain-containing protein n=1 Tax=Halalkalicoccus tibetensis TaxID=175632 RepID=A0ABD5UYT3_9EURY
MSQCFLLGAGASAGCKNSNSATPPMGDWLFADGWKSGLLKKDEFTELLEEVEKEVGSRRGIGDSRLNSEVFLENLDQNFRQEVENGNNRESNRLQKALSESYYYFYELFRQYVSQYTPGDDNYTSLATHILESDQEARVISLNYDTMFEKAIKHEQSDYHYGGLGRRFYRGPKHKARSISISKVHGSIN